MNKPPGDDRFGRAVEHHQQGRLTEAESLYRGVLAQQPRHAGALQLLGVLLHQRGEHEAALKLIRQAIACGGADAACHSNLGIVLRALRRWDEAAEQLRRAIQLDPQHLGARKNLAVVLTELGLHDEAMDQLRAALAMTADDAGLHKQLGIALLRHGRLHDAAESLSQAVALQPDDTEVRNNLGVVLKDLDRLDEAAEHLRKVIEYDSENADAHNNLGLVRLRQGRFAESVDHLRQAVQRNPRFTVAYNNLAVALKRTGALAEALEQLEQALQLQPEYVAALNNLGDTLNLLGRPREAATHLRRALDLDPACHEAHNNLGVALKDRDRVDEAILHLRRSLELAPDYFPAHNNLANALIAEGRVAEGIAHFQQVLRSEPNCVPAFYGLASCGESTIEEADVERMERLAAAGNLSLEDRGLLRFSLSLVYAQRDRHAEAFAHGEQANRLKRQLLLERGTAFDRARHVRLVDRLVATFTAEQLGRGRSLGIDSELPLFVVGMPRSGTTLVEQILASHPQVFGAGELSDIERMAADLSPELGTKTAYPDCISQLDPVTARRLAKAQLDRLQRRGGGTIRVVDKMTVNFLHLGLISLLFPGARVVHCRRDARDVCVSCFFHNFASSGLAFAFDLADLGSYYRQYERIMSHWREVLPIALFDLCYEDLVADQETVSRRLIEFCGLPWDERCLAYYKQPRQVKTASNLQVRRPIYTTSVGRWRKYESQLQPLFQVLEGAAEPSQALAGLPPAESGGAAAATAHKQRGISLMQSGRPAEAAAAFESALALKPDDAEAHNNLGVARKELGQLNQAVASYRQAVQHRPQFAGAMNNLGIVLTEQGKLAEAVQQFRAAIQIEEQNDQAHHNLGVALRELGELDDSVASLRRALQLNPGHVDAHNNLGASLQIQGQVTEALQCYERALQLQPDHAWAHFNRSQAWLLSGDFRHGWVECEWRWRRPGIASRSFRQPRWDGAPPDGRTVLLYAEQGLGDTLQFVRYASQVKQLGGKVIVECQPALKRLLGSCQGIDELVGKGDELPEFDLHCPLMSLPAVFQTTVATIPAAVPYLRADPELIEQWRRRLAGVDGFRVGICWQGNPSYSRDRDRSPPLACFARLAETEGVRLISLQKGLGVEQLASLDQFDPVDFGTDLDEAAGPFMDTAAVMSNLDLVITSDTAIPHLAGALGVPVWTALANVPDWRWLLDRDDSPWYPTMRLFRQPEAGNWAAVFERMARELHMAIAEPKR